MIDPLENYRVSHASAGYGSVYDQTYARGYYRAQWEALERPLLRELLAREAGRGAKRGLDFACGTGRITAVLEEAMAETVGVDVSPAMLAQARQAVRRATVLEQDLTKTPFEQPVDVVTAFRFFLNAEPQLRRAALGALHGALRPGGALIANVHVNASSPLGLTYRLRNALLGRRVANTLGYREFTALLADTGFLVESTYWYSYLPRPGWFASALTARLVGPVDRLVNAISLVPKGLAQSFLVVARRV